MAGPAELQVMPITWAPALTGPSLSPPPGSRRACSLREGGADSAPEGSPGEGRQLVPENIY